MNDSAWYSLGVSPRNASDISAANSGVRLAKKPANVGPAAATPAPQQRYAITAGPTATNTSAMASGQPQTTGCVPSAHSPAAKTADQATPKAIWPIRKYAQLARSWVGSLGRASIQL